MIKAITKINVYGKTASQIYEWLLSLNREKYLEWHPAHTDGKALKKTESVVGTIFFFAEVIDNVKINFEWEVVEAIKNQLVLTKARIFYPVYLSLSMEETANGTAVTHEVRLGFKFAGIEKLFDWLIRALIFTGEREKKLSRHALEEFTRLEQLIE